MDKRYSYCLLVLLVLFVRNAEQRRVRPSRSNFKHHVNIPVEVPDEVPVEVPVKNPVNIPVDVPDIKVPIEAPVKVPVNIPVKDPVLPVIPVLVPDISTEPLMNDEVDDQPTDSRDQFSGIPIRSERTDIAYAPLDCTDLFNLGNTESGVYTVFVGAMQRPLLVYCDMLTNGGGWTVFQRRQDGSVDFYRDWANYTSGFGNIRGEFWLDIVPTTRNRVTNLIESGVYVVKSVYVAGNHDLHYLLHTDKAYELRIDLADFKGNVRYAVYDNFRIGDSDCCQYKLLSIGQYSGTAGDSMSYSVGSSFSTPDLDNDLSPGNCGSLYRGGWWYKNCHFANLNGYYYGGSHPSYADGVEWFYWTGYHYSLRFTEMKFRPRS